MLRRNSEFASARLASADAAVHERDLRAVKLEGDVAEQLQRARLQRYNAAKSLVEADKAMVYWYADWARFETSPCQSTASTAPTQPAARPGGRALYLWHSAEWLTEGATELGERKLRAIHAAGIERLLVSLDAAQMRRVSADPSSLLRAVRNTHEHGFKVELLLGDPDWIRPEQRAGLLRIIEALKSVPFDGLHLDLEPAQIDPAPDRLPALLGSLAETLVAASAASPWPVALSVHPRDLDAPVGDSSFAEVLHRLRVSPTLMVYVANPDRAVEIAEPLLAHHPELSFSVALSLANEAFAQLPQARLNAVFPTGGQRGTSIDVTLAGGVDLDEASYLYISHPGITAVPKTQVVDGKPQPVAGQFVVTIAGDAAVGVYDIRAYSKYGLSNPRTFVVGDLKEVGRVFVGQHPEWFTFTPDGNYCYIAAAGDNSVTVVDVKAIKVVAHIPV